MGPGGTALAVELALTLDRQPVYVLKIKPIAGVPVEISIGQQITVQLDRDGPLALALE